MPDSPSDIRTSNERTLDPLLCRELQPAERVLWSGRPDSARVFGSSDVWLIPFGVCWNAGVVLYEASTIGRGATFGALWGVPFIAIGVYLMLLRFFERRWISKRTVYAVTDRRAIALMPGWRGARRACSVWFASHPPVERRIARDGQGTIWIGSFRSKQERPTDLGLLQPSPSGTVVFIVIPEAAGVYGLIARELSAPVGAGHR